MTGKLLDIKAAAGLVLAEVSALDAEAVDLADARGRFTAASVPSAADLPGFDNSVMDGFAVRSVDTVGAGQGNAVSLEVIGESRAGAPSDTVLGAGQAIGISTGARIPEGADSVLQKEVVDIDGKHISSTTEVEPGHDIRRQGEVTRAGDVVIAAGVKIGPVEAGALAATGHGKVSCHRRPTVSLLTSGDELVEPGRPLGPGEIWNSNQFAVSSLVAESGAELISAGTVPDRLDATVSALEKGLEADLTVICGGVSVGEHDHVKPALAELGVDEIFWGLALKPGRPTWFGRRGDARVLGLPGNPVSALVVFRLLALPLLRALSGGPARTPKVTGRLASPVKRLPGRLHAVPCHPAADGHPDDLVPMPQLGSHDFLSLLGATTLALIEPGSGSAEAGEEVETLPLGGH